jgi:glycosyltransferase involved in cell wall biosynthesis
MNIVLAIEVIAPGGAETFVLRLAKALEDKGNRVIVFAFYKNKFNQALHRALAPNVQLIWPHMRLPWLARKIDGLFFRLKIDRNIQKKYIKGALTQLAQASKTDIIHSNLLKVDRISAMVGNDLNVPVVTTIHGDYLQFYEKERKREYIPILNYSQKAKWSLSNLKKVVCISDKQIDFFKKNFPAETEGKINKIYNGYAGSIPADRGLKQQLGIGANEFVYGMVSRGIAEKGWEPAIDAFNKLGRPDTRLILVGGGEYLEGLKAKYTAQKNIHFVGHSDEPLEWINIFDAGLLPSTYASESLPTAVIEYLFCNKPTIASDAGEINNMLSQDGRKAGITIPIQNDKIDTEQLAQAMQQYLDDKALYELHKSNTAACFSKFDMDLCADRYLDLYIKAIAGIAN